MDAAIQAMFNNACCGGSTSGCEAVEITGDVPAHSVPSSQANHGFITIIHTLAGTSPFELLNVVVPYDFITIQLSGNQVYIRINTAASTVFQYNTAYNISYDVTNCGGEGSTSYAGTVTVTN